MSRQGAYLVTGAGSGIGQAIAKKIIEQGHLVFGLGRSFQKLEDASRSLPSFSFSAVDLSQTLDTQRVCEEVRAWLKEKKLPLLGLVNNAAIFERVSFLESSDEVWQSHFNNNLMSAVRLTRELLPELKRSAPSSILNISSTLGLRPVQNTSSYSAFKAAMINWTQSLALECASEKVRSNCICPGLVDTPMHPFHNKKSGSENVDKMQPLGRVGQPEDIAHAAWFLLSEQSNWTTGAVLAVDGGINL